MTDNEIIAKALGWEYDGGTTWRRKFEYYIGICLPYDSDHNLVHEAEAMLTEEEQLLYLGELYLIINRDNNPKSTYQAEWYLRHATAAQCARAMATVLGQRDPK